jgi:dTDP-4-dehydrorhamnose reductase
MKRSDLRWLVTGAAGQFGHHVSDQRASGADVVAVTATGLDITDRAAVDETIAAYRPDVVLNAAAYTAVDAAETDEQPADAVNQHGPRLLAEAVRRCGGRLLHVSTDYVFDGTASRPYEIDDPVGPQGAYGQTKLVGERAVGVLPDRAHVVRTAWICGWPGPDFVDIMLCLERERETLDVVADQIGNPTWVAELAAALIELGASAVPAGVLHYVNGGQALWFDLAREVFRLVVAEPSRIRPADTAAFPHPARRPAWCCLRGRGWRPGCERRAGGRMRSPPHWRAHQAGQCRGPFVDIAQFCTEEE